MRKHPEGAPEGNEASRSEGPSPADESRGAAAPEGASPAEEGRGSRRRRSRNRKRAPGEQELFSPEEIGAPPASANREIAAEGPEGGGEGKAGGKKSRSQRRRERRRESATKRVEGGESSEGQTPVAGPDRPEPLPVRDQSKAREGKPERRDRREERPKADRPRDEKPRRDRPERPDRPPRGERGPEEGRRRDRPDRPYEDRPRRDRDERRRAEDRPRGDRRFGPRHEGDAQPAREADFKRRSERTTEGVPSFMSRGGALPPELAALDEELQPPFGSQFARPGARPKAKPAPTSRILETLSPSPESLRVLERLEAVLDESQPLSPKHRSGLRGDIRALWEELTSDREYRSADYLGTPPAMSAYLRYFLPWNVYRLTAIFSNADFCLPDRAVVVDIGSGPLTMLVALYAARPELREVPLTFYCLDRVERVMEAGLVILETLCMRHEGRLPPWKVIPVKDGFGAPLPERAHLLTAANVFNEFFWKDKRSLGERALATARTLLSYTRENGSLFLMEPGDPRSGAFMTSIRAALAAEGAHPLGPCPHSLSCPMPGIFRHLLPPEETRPVKGDPNAAPSRYVLPPVAMPKKRDKFPWCHFGVDTDQAPRWLQALSEEAGLPKDRAVLTYLWAARGSVVRMPAGGPPVHGHSEKERRAKAGRGILVRVVSEPFGLPDGSTGQYACSSLGYTLLKRPRGEEAFEPGDLLEVAAQPLQRNDEKSGAIVLPS